MRIVFDPVKDAANLAKHGLSLSDFRGFDEEPMTVVDDRVDYGEQRFQARGRIDGKGFCLVYTETADGIRLISLRRAHAKEMRRHE
ncbi:BrnT family toxin [Sphingomonas sp. CLY1604]|uniref:BrnT family toxin n=1 Tax=Sphingomonas sp. CLY1604 TaxID=3457786 RepID=UPI003FD88E03